MPVRGRLIGFEPETPDYLPLFLTDGGMNSSTRTMQNYNTIKTEDYPNKPSLFRISPILHFRKKVFYPPGFYYYADLNI